MKFKGKGKGVWKKITALVATGILMSSSKSTINAQTVEPVKNVREVDVNDDLLGDPIYDNDNLVKKIKDFQTNTSKTSEDLVVKVLKGLLEGQFETNSVLINSEFNEYISGIIIDGRNIVVEFKGGEKVQGDAERLELDGLVLEKLYIYDTECMNDYVNMSYSDLKEKYKNREQLYIEINNTSVTKEFKACDMYFPDVFYSYDFDEEYLNLNNCENIWLDDFDWSDINKYINSWNSAQNIILTDLYVDDEYEDNIIIKNNNLKNIIIEPLISISNIDLSGCDKLECLIGIGSIEQIHGPEEADVLKTLSKGLNDDICFFSTEEKIQQYIIKNLTQAKESIKNQFLTHNAYIDKRYNNYINGIKVDGKNVEIEFQDGDQIDGICEHVEIDTIVLNYLFIYDSKYLKQSTNEDFVELRTENNKNERIYLNLNNVQVLDEVRIDNQSSDDVEFYFSLDNRHIDISNCKRVWIENMIISEEEMQCINSLKSLEKLIISNSAFIAGADDILRINIDTLETLIIGFSINWNNYKDFDLNGCPNLKVLSIGGNFLNTNLNGIAQCMQLKSLAFGPLIGDETTITDIIYKSFEEKEDEIGYGYDTSNKALGYNDNNFISDITALKNKTNIEVLNISFLQFVSSDQLLEVVKSLTKLKKIVGFEINQAPMCSEELVEHCAANHIEQPFTEKSLELKRNIRDIIDSIITPEMNELDKIREISIYIINHLQPMSGEIIGVKGAWGENLLYCLTNGFANCEGYQDLGSAFMMEANINVSNCSLIIIDKGIIGGHVINIIEYDGNYYEIDFGWLDSFIEELGISPEQYDFEINSVYYMIPVGEGEIGYYGEKRITYSEPIDSKIQRDMKIQELLDNNNETNSINNIYINEKQKNDTRKEEKNNYIALLIGILLALGIAKHVSKKELKILRQIYVTKADNYIWNIEDLQELCKPKDKEEYLIQ